MSVPRRKFTREFKLQVIQEIEAGIKTRAQATREYELSEGLIGKWVQAYRKDPEKAFTGTVGGVGSEVDRLKSRISQLEAALGRKTMEVEILKDTLDKLKVKRGSSTN